LQHFNPNPYFEDTKLTKTFTYADDEGATKITATSIKWKEGMVRLTYITTGHIILVCFFVV
jgi:hypothetical protein